MIMMSESRVTESDSDSESESAGPSHEPRACTALRPQCSASEFDSVVTVTQAPPRRRGSEPPAPGPAPGAAAAGPASAVKVAAEPACSGLGKLRTAWTRTRTQAEWLTRRARPGGNGPGP